LSAIQRPANVESNQGSGLFGYRVREDPLHAWIPVLDLTLSSFTSLGRKIEYRFSNGRFDASLSEAFCAVCLSTGRPVSPNFAPIPTTALTMVPRANVPASHLNALCGHGRITLVSQYWKMLILRSPRK